MGHIELTMDSKRGKASPVSDCNSSLGSSVRGRSLNTSPFCPRSSSKLTQSIVKDHMVSHYKKIYLAKAAIDSTAPKSLIHSVKYNDQLKRDQLRRGGRPQSAHSVLQGHGRDSRSSKESRGSLEGGENSPFFCSGSSIFSTPRHLNTSFHAKQVVYPSHGARSRPRLPDTASEFSFRRSETDLYRQHSARPASPVSGAHQSPYAAFKDPVQKTYSGDLLHKHAHYFTHHDQPFTPRTLKSDKSSSLSKYRYYTAPKRNPIPDPDHSRLMQPQTNHRRRELKQHTTLDYDDQPQGFSTDHGWSEDESIDSHVSLSTNQRHSNRSWRSLSRASPEGMKSPSMTSTSEEEDELMYLEFIVNITDDILSRGLFSDRVLDRVFERHIEKNRRRLNEGKMRHLLEVLRKDFEDPGNTPTWDAAEAAEKDLLGKHLSRPVMSRQWHTKEEEADLFPDASLNNTNCDSPTSAVSSSIPLRGSSPEPADSAIDTKQDLEELQLPGVTVPDCLNDNGNQYTGIDDQDLHTKPEISVTDTADLSQEQREPTSGEALHPDPLGDGRDGLSKELEDLGMSLAESLCVTQSSNQGSPKERHRDTCSSLSDDEF